MNGYMVSINLSVCECILLAFITQTVRVNYDKNITKNKLSLFPYYIIMCFLVTQALTYWMQYEIDSTYQKYELTIYYILGNVNCFCWC